MTIEEYSRLTWFFTQLISELSGKDLDEFATLLRKRVDELEKLM